MVRLRSGNAPTPAKTAATGRPILREKTNTTTGTPAPAVETSMLALKNFKRRPRQGSMLEMVRKRRSSVQASLISARPQQDDDVEDTSVFDLGSASEGEDVFAPEAEGTPLQASKTRKSTSTRKSVSAKKSVAATTPAVKRTKRKSDDLESPHSALDALRAKHRKSEAPPVEDEPLPSIDDDEQQPIVNDTSDHEASPMPNQVTSDVQVINSSPESTPPTEPSSTRKIPGTEEADFAVPSTEEQERLHTLQQDALEDEPEEEEEEEEEDEAAEDEDDLDTPNATMAEPASSSPNGSPIPDTQRTDIYADPLTQLSPPPPEPAKTRSKGNNKKPTAMSTATLRALLPRRTQRPQSRPKRTEYDISSDEEDDATAFDTTHLEDDEDELGGRIRRQTKAPAPSKGSKAATAKSKSKSKSTTSTRKPSAPLPPAKNKSKSKSKAKTTTRTYGRATTTTSDKENEEVSSENDEQTETSMSMREVTHSKELEEARRKFAEVDNWDLTFESMSNEDHRSSSQGWR
jgi:hypothetical protein